MRSKLHGHGSEAIYIGPPENSSHRSGLFLKKDSREVIIRRSFTVWNDRPPYEFLVSKDTTSMVQFIESTDNKLNNDSDLTDLVDDSDSDSDIDSEHDVITKIEVDTNEYHWSPVKLSSLPHSKRNLVQRMCSENYLDYEESHVPPTLKYVWKVNGLSRRPDSDSLYVRYWDASLPQPRDSNSL